MKTVVLNIRVLFIGLLSFSVVPPTLSGADIELTPVALSQQSAPGLGAGIEFGDLFQSFPPVINNSGEVLFTAVLAGLDVGVTNDRSIWTGSPGSLQMVAREGDPAPDGGGGVLFSAFFSNRPALTDNGQVMFDATVNGAGVSSSNNQGLWVGTATSQRLLVRTGDPAPDIGGGVLVSSLRMPASGIHVLTDNGETTFNLLLTGSGVVSANNMGIWSGTVDELLLRGREGTIAPDGPGSAVFRDLFNTHPTINASGQIAFATRLTGSGISTANDYGLWRGQPDALQLILREGIPAPGVDGANLVFFGRPVINQSGQLAFNAALAGASVDSSNDFSIWVHSEGSLQMVAREGSPAPGAEPALFGNLSPDDPYLNNQGQIAFSTILTGEGLNGNNDTGIWAGDPDNIQLIARAGQPAPGTADGIVFDSLRFVDPVVNSAGQIAFTAKLSGLGAGNSDGIWITDSAGDLHLLIKENEEIEIAPGDLRTVDEIKGIFGGGDGDSTTTSLNNSGQITFAATFNDGTSGIFIVQLKGPDPVVLSATVDSPGVIRLSWEPTEGFVLQTAPTITGPWTDAENQSNPQLIETLGDSLYFRLRAE